MQFNLSVLKSFLVGFITSEPVEYILASANKPCIIISVPLTVT